MKKFVLLLLFTLPLFSQEPIVDNDNLETRVLESLDTLNILTKSLESVVIEEDLDTIPEIDTTKVASPLFDNYDLRKIDSLLTVAKFDSPLIDSTKYVINNGEIIANIEPIVPTEKMKERLKRINQTTPFHLEYNPALEKVINNYVKCRRKYYPTLMARAKYYFPIFEQYLSKYDIPLEMKYLAIVESALHPKIKSPVGATGLWQFMYGTGRQFDLDINSYVDERQDPIKSTIAACKYLKVLYEMFGDWDLALAAYNSGPGNVLKAIKRSGGHKNYWNLRPFLPYETAGYVPAFYATMYIFKYAEELGIQSEKPNFYYFETDTIQLKRSVSFKNIAEKTGITEEVLEILNPKYKINYIPYVEGKNFSIRIPRNKSLEFLDKEPEIYALAGYDESLREKPMAKYVAAQKGNHIRYKVKSGDYLGKIARKFGVKVRQIKRWNNMRSARLSVGQRLLIYPRRM